MQATEPVDKGMSGGPLEMITSPYNITGVCAHCGAIGTAPPERWRYHQVQCAIVMSN